MTKEVDDIVLEILKTLERGEEGTITYESEEQLELIYARIDEVLSKPSNKS